MSHAHEKDDAPGPVDRAWFESRLSALRLSQKDVADRMGLAPSALSRALRGARHFKAAEIKRMAAILRVSEAEVLDRMVEKPARAEPAKIPPRTGAGVMEGQAAFADRFEMKDENDAYIVPPRGADPLFGCVAGSLTLLPDVDYAAPAEPDWERAYDD